MESNDGENFTWLESLNSGRFCISQQSGPTILQSALEDECCHLILSNHKQNYIKILRDHRVTHLVCATDPTYKTEDIEHEGVRFTSIPFQDGSPPTAEVNMRLW